MELINRKTIQSKLVGRLYVTIDTDGLFFTRASSETFNVVPGKRVEFMGDESSWAFAVTNDPDGFLVGKNGVKAGSTILSRGLVDHILKCKKFKLKGKYKLVKSMNAIKNAPLIQILPR